ncbi:zinc ribbon domain-containing protein [Burkholderia cepacia]|uniref:zinc ribbon domain-containing protein n=1 Tax=Burkholderia cepacia TaxID=292 RepID=UPI00158A1675|nr:zinc ribbon domain-containing protein [Burkholderia cepacia]MDN7894587.1 zinc ribbon domain-containing protein [Burkholderia cepacia]
MRRRGSDQHAHIPARRRHADRRKEEDYLFMTQCTHCESELPDGLKFCIKCGTPVAAAQPRIDATGTPCRRCHTELTPNQRFCNKCGTPVASADDIDVIDVELPAPPVEPLRAPEPARPSGHVAAETAHEIPHGAAEAPGTHVAPFVEAAEADVAVDDASPGTDIAEMVSSRVSAPVSSPEPAEAAARTANADDRDAAAGTSHTTPAIPDPQPASVTAAAIAEAAVESHDVSHNVPDIDVPPASAAEVPDTVVTHAGESDPPVSALEETIVLPASAQPERPASGAAPQPVPPAAPTNRDTSATPKIIAAGVALVVACAGGAFWWHGRHASTPAAPEPAAASAVPAMTGDAASSLAASGAIATAVGATASTDAPASAPINAAAIAASATVPASTPVVVTNAAPVAAPVTPPASNAPPVSVNAQQTSPFATLQDNASAPSEPAAIAAAPHVKPRPTLPARTAAATAPASPAIDGLLKRAQGDLSRGQYDKAIATAESVLTLEPGNRPAKTLIDKAKARQMDALRNNSTLE